MEPLADASTQALAIAVEDNEAEFLLAMGRAGGGEERNDGEITWNIGSSPIAYHNCVVRADLTPERADDAIAASKDLMRAKGVPGSWHVGPSMRPADLHQRLRAQGFEGGPEPGMAADLDALPAAAGTSDLHITRVSSDPHLDAYAHVLSLGFGEGPPEAKWVRAIYGLIGLGDDADWRHYIGHLDAQPVATASVFFAAGVAGLYFVCTTPYARRRGIGTEISRAALVGARELGFRIGVLGTSPMGRSIYERLGFREVCDVHVYEWSPDADR